MSPAAAAGPDRHLPASRCHRAAAAAAQQHHFCARLSPAAAADVRSGTYRRGTSHVVGRRSHDAYEQYWLHRRRRRFEHTDSTTVIAVWY